MYKGIKSIKCVWSVWPGAGVGAGVHWESLSDSFPCPSSLWPSVWRSIQGPAAASVVTIPRDRDREETTQHPATATLFITGHYGSNEMIQSEAWKTKKISVISILVEHNNNKLGPGNDGS